MVSGQERRKHARLKPTGGNVSHYAQQRVNKRVMEILSRRDAARRNSSSAQTLRRGGQPRS